MSDFIPHFLVGFTFLSLGIVVLAPLFVALYLTLSKRKRTEGAVWAWMLFALHFMYINKVSPWPFSRSLFLPSYGSGQIFLVLFETFLFVYLVSAIFSMKLRRSPRLLRISCLTIGMVGLSLLWTMDALYRGGW